MRNALSLQKFSTLYLGKINLRLWLLACSHAREGRFMKIEKYNILHPKATRVELFCKKSEKKQKNENISEAKIVLVC